MRFSILIGVALAAFSFATSNDSSAATFMHPFNCKLVNTTAPYAEVSASHSGGYFINATGSSKWAMCPISHADTEGDYYRIYYDNPSNMTCWLQTVSTGGAVSIYAPTYTSANFSTWNLANLPAVEMQCLVPNNGKIWVMVNY